MEKLAKDREVGVVVPQFVLFPCGERRIEPRFSVIVAADGVMTCRLNVYSMRNPRRRVGRRREFRERRYLAPVEPSCFWLDCWLGWFWPGCAVVLWLSIALPNSSTTFSASAGIRAFWEAP